MEQLAFDFTPERWLPIGYFSMILESDSAVFRRPDQGHRTSPWFKLPLRLHTTASAQARYDDWASGEWER